MYTGDMDKDLEFLIPEAVAICYSNDPSIIDYLVARAKRLYRTNKYWGRMITDTNKGRDRLHAFMKHWAQGVKAAGEVH